MQACTYIALSKENLDKAISTYQENRRVNKRNWMTTINEEMLPDKKMSPRNPCLLRQYASSRYTERQYERNPKEEQSVEDIMKEKYEELEAWRANTDRPITDFFFFAAKRPKPAATAFINDVTLNLCM